MLNEPPGALVSGHNVPLLLFDELVTPPTGSSSHGSSMRSRARCRSGVVPIAVLLALYFAVQRERPCPGVMGVGPFAICPAPPRVGEEWRKYH